ncbi:transmembrane protein [Thraustotheca clavata]|uniref:Transmembrane protein n=1 Tax=Thraustotheca clavata TaxID=74557 RepID=A0A1W0ACU8_9STRA|nr:transmembrane protein [Thraustotheca clavata]
MANHRRWRVVAVLVVLALAVALFVLPFSSTSDVCALANVTAMAQSLFLSKCTNTNTSLTSLIHSYVPLEKIEENAAVVFGLPELSTYFDAAQAIEALKEATTATWTAFIAWVALLKLIVIPLLAYLVILIDILMPHVKSASMAAYDTFLALKPEVQIGLVSTSTFLLIAYRKGYFRKIMRAYFRLRATLKRVYKKFLAQVYAKSKIAGIALPHAVFALIAYIVVSTSPDFVVHLLGHENLLIFLSSWVPVLKSIQTIHIRRRKQLTMPLTPTDDEYLEHCLKVWVPWALYITSVSLVTLFLPNFISSTLTVSGLTTNIFLIWFHLPITRGYRVIYQILSSWMHPYADRIPAAARNEVESANVVLRAMTAIGAISERSAHILRDLRAQGPALAGLIFLGTPGFLTMRGCDCVALAFPAFVVMSTMTLGHRRTHEWWVCYFTVVSIVESIFSSLEVVLWWVPLFYHLKLFVMLYLQFPYFRGAQTIFDGVFHSVFILRPRQPRSPTNEQAPRQ